MIWLLLACSSSEPSPEHVARDVVDPPSDSAAPSLPDIEQSAAVATMTVTEIVDAIETALRTPPRPRDVTDAYIHLMSLGDPECPGDPENIMDQWVYGCDAETGYSYAGVTDWFTEESEDVGESGTLIGLAGDFWIDTPTGHQLEGGGHAVTVNAPGMWVGEIAGSWAWTDGPDWIAGGYSGNLRQEVFAGGFVGFSGAADILGTHIAGHDLVLPDVCPGKAVGGLSLRDPSGGWYRMDFADCSSCAEVYFEGTPMGEGCIDFNPYIEIMKGRL